MTPSTAESTTIENTNLDPRRPGDPCCRAGWNIRSDAAVIWRSPNQSEISHCTTRCRLMFVQRPGPILGSGLSAGPSPFFTAVGAAAWRCSNRRATGVESLAELQPTHRQVAGFRFSGARAQIRGFSGPSAPGQRRAPVFGHVVPARGIVEKGDADDHEGSPGWCRPKSAAIGPRDDESDGRQRTVPHTLAGS